MLRPVDATEKGVPDPFRTATRGAKEELGIELRESEVVFTHFGVTANLCEYSLFGWAHIPYSKQEVEQLRSLTAKDNWETMRLVFVPCTPSDIASYVLENKERWQIFGLIPIVLSLFSMGYPHKEINRAFENIN